MLRVLTNKSHSGQKVINKMEFLYALDFNGKEEVCSGSIRAKNVEEAERKLQGKIELHIVEVDNA